MSSLYAEYIRERLSQLAIEHEWGFLTYDVAGEIAELHNIYVTPPERKSGKCRRLFEEMIFRVKQAGAKRVVTSVWIQANECETSIQAAIHCGFKMHSAEGGRIILVKELEEGSNG